MSDPFIISIVWLSFSSGSLSTLCSAAIIYMMLSDHRRKLTHQPNNRFLLMMSIIDVLQSIAYASASMPSPRESGVYGAIGNHTTCATQGFLFQLGFAVPCYNACLCIWFLMSIKYNMQPKIFKAKIEPYCHAVSLGFPLSTAIICAVLDRYENMGGIICWINGTKSSLLFVIMLSGTFTTISFCVIVY